MITKREFVLLAAAAGSILILGAVAVFLQLAEKQKVEAQLREVFTDYLSVSDTPEQTSPPSIQETDLYSIILRGYWNRDVVTLSVQYLPDVPESLRVESLERIRAALALPPAAPPPNYAEAAALRYSSWNELLSHLRSESDKVPLLAYTDDFERADIKLYLTNEPHPEGKIGFTRLYLDRITKEIISAEVRGFGLNNLVANNINSVAPQHGIGHALGLGHSDLVESVMYPEVFAVDGVAIGKLGACEASGMKAMYIEGKFGETVC